jgi:hypothetical protein
MTKKALLLLGCPELPVQTGVALYLANALMEVGLAVFVAGTDAALRLLEVSDPRGCYVDAERMKNLDKCIEVLAEKRLDFDFCAVFMHNDAGLSYLATIRSISEAKLFAVIFGRDAEILAGQIDFECEKLVARAVHNPMPLKKKIDTTLEEVKQWAVSN